MDTQDSIKILLFRSIFFSVRSFPFSYSHLCSSHIFITAPSGPVTEQTSLLADKSLFLTTCYNKWTTIFDQSPVGKESQMQEAVKTTSLGSLTCIAFFYATGLLNFQLGLVRMCWSSDSNSSCRRDHRFILTHLVYYIISSLFSKTCQTICVKRV